MKLARNIDRGVLVVVMVALALPAFARANPLLSGYGGPGQGSQALLGTTLTGPRGGGGGGGGAGSGDEATPASAIEAPRASVGGSQTQAAPSGSKHASTRIRRSRHSQGSAPAGAGSSGASGPTRTRLAPASDVHADAAGLSSGDLALILLGIGVVAATGISMARLARGGEREGRDG
ncbi:MAG TPA: hypothetical protein VH115_09845 [Solirubrobacteraceae bacterium]|nr:hypothetical protein [Solirubrobacteraceae bacterium]